jgi:hypothetical protein
MYYKELVLEKENFGKFSVGISNLYSIGILFLLVSFQFQNLKIMQSMLQLIYTAKYLKL